MKGYKTVAFNVVMTAVGVIAVWNPDAELPSADAVTGAFDALEAGFVAVWGIGNVILRAITSTPIFSKE